MELGDRASPVAQSSHLADHVHPVAPLRGFVDLDICRSRSVGGAGDSFSGDSEAAKIETFERIADLFPRVALAQQAGGRLIVVHALEDVSEEEPSLAAHLNIPECWRAVEPEIRAAYEALVPAEAREWCKIDVRIPFGKGYSTILDIARQDGADLIVLGTAGWSSPFGATTQHVLRAAECPVLVVPSVTRTS